VPTEFFVPYCGIAPIPHALIWNRDPVLAGALLFGLGFYLVQWRSRQLSTDRYQLGYFAAGWLILALALISPFCNLSVALFSARSAQHMLITLVAAPLIVRGYAGMSAGDIFFRRHIRTPRQSRGEYLLAPILFALVLWAWHLPRLYDATLENNFAYWAMHISLICAAFGLWRVLLSRDSRRLGWKLTASLFTGIQTCALGAILTLSPRPWFDVYALTTWPWGLSPAADQQLGGVLMWTVGGALLTIYTIALFAPVMRGASKPVRFVIEGARGF
jgi:putative membrane protein